MKLTRSKETKELIKKAKTALKEDQKDKLTPTYFRLRGMLAEDGIQLTNAEAQLIKNKDLKKLIKNPDEFDAQNPVHSELLRSLLNYMALRFQHTEISRAAIEIKNADTEVEREDIDLNMIYLRTRLRQLGHS